MEGIIIFGHITTITETTDGKKYGVLKIKNPENLNFRFFVAGENLVMGQKYKVTLEPVDIFPYPLPSTVQK